MLITIIFLVLVVCLAATYFVYKYDTFKSYRIKLTVSSIVLLLLWIFLSYLSRKIFIP
jgi:hypothetical protein